MISFPIKVRFGKIFNIILGRWVGFGYPLSYPVVAVKNANNFFLFNKKWDIFIMLSNLLRQLS